MFYQVLRQCHLSVIYVLCLVVHELSISLQLASSLSFSLSFLSPSCLEVFNEIYLIAFSKLNFVPRKFLNFSRGIIVIAPYQIAYGLMIMRVSYYKRVTFRYLIIFNELFASFKHNEREEKDDVGALL